MRLNNKLTIIIFLFFSRAVHAQDYFPMSFSIVSKSGNPIDEARVSIKELGYQSSVSEKDGKVFFQDVPVGEIHFFIACEGYNGIDGSFNITTETKSNTLRIELAKIPVQEANLILISGEVLNTEGEDVSAATVEVRAGNNTQKVKTDESGNFNIEFNLDEIKYNVSEFSLEVTKNDCKSKERFIIPKNNYIYKEITIDCSGKDDHVANPNWKNKIGNWDIELIGCEKIGNSVSCQFTVMSNYKDRKFGVIGNGWGDSNYSAMYDNFGDDYMATSITIGNAQGYQGIEKILIANIPVMVNIVFPNISTQASKITLLNLRVWGDDLTVNRVQFRDISIK